MAWRDELIKQRLILLPEQVKSGSVTWRSPSNIALVKYWGKHGVQLPSNPSISFTLTEAHTNTTIVYGPKNGSHQAIDMKFIFESGQNEAFENRIRTYLNSIVDICPFLTQLDLRIESNNSFPHSSGIASSASGFSALALCICTIEHHLFETLSEDALFRKKASYLARLASGSACRSIYSTAALWGHSLDVSESSDEYAVSMENNLHPVFKDYRDAILIISAEQKTTSSRAGHGLMTNHPFAKQRFAQAKQRLIQLQQILSDGNTELFVEIVENEALTLHGLMMSSSKSFVLLKPGTMEVIERIQSFRKRTGIPVCFTLDAGPNVHVLYPNKSKAEVIQLITNELLGFCQNGRWLNDHCGKGPVQIK
jgi:diphosphomevalonate decarboxylase